MVVSGLMRLHRSTRQASPQQLALVVRLGDVAAAEPGEIENGPPPLLRCKGMLRQRVQALLLALQEEGQACHCSSAAAAAAAGVAGADSSGAVAAADGRSPALLPAAAAGR